ncbi:DUF5671 domain-containing protein [Methylocapsa palsarum]|uniref:DUF5671 domain-containing protein n=1 Tax=Methylocapsa palsarum TaxID=1612308 RepID=A0A1I3ZRX3_9HYPH|nr:DUF5671 domain-containing protein [Methylocapsa palsarum]SFK46697.1 hypothetical protein SAMN05444581_108133 [Methylocapsa palsarum]
MNPSLVDFTGRALSNGIERDEISRALRSAGWPEDEIAAALGAFAEVDFPFPVPKPKPHLSARETFIHLVLFVSLYTCLWAIVSIIFSFIDRSLPDPLHAGEGFAETIRNEISTLIVFFPLFVLMFRYAERNRADPARRDSKVRRWIIFLTLFVAAIIFAGDLVALVQSVLGGALTSRFFFKSLTIAIVAGGLFAFFLHDVRQDEQQ